MATYTTYYQLIKPQGADLYNVQNFNDNADSIDNLIHTNAVGIKNINSNIADDFVPNSRYYIGDKVINEGVLYKVISQHNPPYTISDLQAFVLGKYLSREDIASKLVKQLSDITRTPNAYKKCGIISIAGQVSLFETTFTPNTWNTLYQIDNTDVGYVPRGYSDSDDVYGTSASSTKVRCHYDSGDWLIQIYPESATSDEYINIMYMTED